MGSDTVELNITGSGAEMEGVARLNGMAVFVPGALPGERIRARIIKQAPRFARAELVEILSPSEERRIPQCPISASCGGCTLMHMSYRATLDEKARQISDCLERIGGAQNALTAMHGMENPYAYRNKAQFPVGGTASAPRVGFYRGLTHEVIDLPEGCMLLNPKLNSARKIFAEWMRRSAILPYDERAHKGLVRHAVFRVNRAGEFMAIIVANGEKLPEYQALWAELHKIGCVSLMLSVLTDAPDSRRNTEILGRRFIRLAGAERYIDEILGCKFELSAPSFFQINPEMTDVLYSLALKAAGIKSGQTLLDAYCGAGTIGLTLIRRSGAAGSRLIGIESVAEAVSDARKNAELNDMPDAKFICGRCEIEMAKLLQKGACPDVAIIDPPRKGCDEALLKALDELKARTLRRIVYISCNPATLSRDVKFMRALGWRVEWAEGVDMFPWTPHVETVCLMSRVEGK